MMSRKERIEKLEADCFDVLVVGGGITGAGIALDAVQRGMKVALVEMRDFASGTSSRSTKLIHGGLRYLKQGDFGLVNEVGRERAIVHKLAPQLVHPDRMLLPLVKNGNYGFLLTAVGLAVYDFLAGVNRRDRKRMLGVKQTLRTEPLLNSEGLKGAGFYAEYRTDDARLTLAVLTKAVEKGAVVLNYAKVVAFTNEGDQMTGARVCDEETGQVFHVKARVVVGAVGPWTDELRLMNDRSVKRVIRHTKGIHLVVPRSKIPIQYTVYFDHSDGRMLFAIPRDEKVYLGTTDTDYHGSLEEPSVTRSDATYVLDAVNRMFPSAHLQLSDVESSWAGVRPLIEQPGKSASSVSRRDEVFTTPNGMLLIAGGKLTGYRKMAERIVQRVALSLGVRRPSLTHRTQLTGSEYASYASVENHINAIVELWAHIRITPEQARYLVHTYGRCADAIIEGMDGEGEWEWQMIRSELKYCVENEFVEHAVDYYERRSGRLFFNVQSLHRYGHDIVQELAKLKGWSVEQVAKEVARLNDDLYRVVRFSDDE
jgi:glycerol-3-phosphate dehydrogenase